MNDSKRRALILVVDDVEDDRVYLRAVLEGAGYEVRVAEDAENGLQQARQEHPALIVMDVQLPGISGLEATRRLKSDPLTARTPVIVVTAHALDRGALREARYDALLHKPVDQDELTRQVEQLLRDGIKPE